MAVQELSTFLHLLVLESQIRPGLQQLLSPQSPPSLKLLSILHIRSEPEQQSLLSLQVSPLLTHWHVFLVSSSLLGSCLQDRSPQQSVSAEQLLFKAVQLLLQTCIEQTYYLLTTYVQNQQ